MTIAMLCLLLACGDKGADTGTPTDGGAADGGAADGGGNPDDVDGDGFSKADGDCDDTDGSVYPGADEIPWDGVDQDCDDEDAGTTQSGTGEGDLPIPDEGQVESTALIGPCDRVYGTTVTVDITHPYIGDLVLSLVTPDGTAHALHVRSGTKTDDIVGTYSSDKSVATLDAAVPLSKLDGVTGTGEWTLLIQDMQPDDTGTLNAWGLELRCP